MLINIALGLSVMAVCLILEAMLLVATFHFYTRNKLVVQTPSMWSTFRVLSGVMAILVMGNLAQVGLWAALFQSLGEFGDYATAFYHSAVNFATLGYGDLVMSEKHRLLGPIESLNGGLMIGVSTAALMTALQDALRETVRARGH